MRLGIPARKAQGNQDPDPGLYTYTREFDGGRAQIHLRIEYDGRSLLLVNANRAVHLNPTATIMAWLTLENHPQVEILKILRKRFRASGKTLSADYALVREQVEQLIRPDGACPVHDLELDMLPPFSEKPSAPYRMDLALTYRCNANCAHCYNARARSYPEMTTDEWRRAIDNLLDIGVPHICFTGGEATLREDLPDLIAHAGSKGQITGLLTNGRKLSDQAFVERLVEAGLDHIQITLESHDPQIHDDMVRAQGAWRDTVEGIRNSLSAGLFVMTNTTLLEANSPSIGETLDFLAELGVPTIGCNALIYSGRGTQVGTGIPEDKLAPLLDVVRERTSRYGQRLIWYTPTQYCHFDPMQMELGVKGCTAAMYNMCVEPDGGVIPCQSYYKQLGNLLQDTWETIWNHDLAIWLRERQYVPEPCHDCVVLQECGGGCPLTLVQQQDSVPLNEIVIPEQMLKG
jgi:radical SAM protein with 4Fe4S-binding SPASM domain